MRWVVVTAAVLLLTSGCAVLPCNSNKECPDGVSCVGAAPKIPAENPFQSDKPAEVGHCDCPLGQCEDPPEGVGGGQTGTGVGGAGGGQ